MTLSAHLVREESAKRDRHLDPAEHLRSLQRFLADFDRNQPMPRNSIAACRANEERILRRRQHANPR
jgi:hypothetical protein